MNWNTDKLIELLKSNSDWAAQHNGDVLEVTNEDGILILITVSGEQISARSLLFPHDQIKDNSLFNDALLRTQHLFPLAAVNITTIEGADYYESCGELSSQSKSETILIEVDTLFDTTEGMLVMYENHLETL